MEQKREVASLIILIISLVVLTSKLFAPSPVSIIVEGGQAISLEGGGYFTYFDIIVVLISAWIAGMSAFYLLRTNSAEDKPQKDKIDISSFALNLLEGDEKKVYKHIVDSGEAILQKDLVMEMGFDKAKITRLLGKLEGKDLILKIKHGMTNRIVLKKKQ